MGEIADRFGVAFRDYSTVGIPASGAHEPLKRDIRAIAIPIEAAIAAAALAGGDLEAAQALIAPLAQSAAAAQLAAESAAESAQAILATFPARVQEAVASILATVANQPAVAAIIVESVRQNATSEARALLYGIASPAEQKLFVAETRELAFAEPYYRNGYMPLADHTQLPGWEPNNTVVTEKGIPVFGIATPAIAGVGIGGGDITILIEVDIGPAVGETNFLVSLNGSAIEQRIALYRSDTATYALQVYNNSGLQTVASTIVDANARRIKAAFTAFPGGVKACFDGGEVIEIAAERPEALRLALGNLSVGFNNQISGYVRGVLVYDRAVDEGELKLMTGDNIAVDDLADLIDQRITSHDADKEAHELSTIRQQADLADSKTGIWSVKAADTFSGADGPLTNTEVGNFPWDAMGGAKLVRSSGKAISSDGALCGNIVHTGVADGQVEAVLFAGNNEASLYLRWQSAGNYLLLQRKPDGLIIMYRFINGSMQAITPLTYRPSIANEKYKVRMIGPRLWVLRTVDDVEELLFDLIEPAFQEAGDHGLRLAGTGSADNFRVLLREAL